MSVETYSVMLGLVMKSVVADTGNDEMTFTSECGKVFKFYHGQDCCESVQIEDVCGDLEDLVGSPLVLAEEVSNLDQDPPEVEAESYTWTFYRYGTAKGSVTVRWLGTSNGYYGEGVSYSFSDENGQNIDLQGTPCKSWR